MRKLILALLTAACTTASSPDATSDALPRAETRADLALANDAGHAPDALAPPQRDARVLPDLAQRVDLAPAPDLVPSCGGDHEPCCTSGAPCGVDGAGRALTCMVKNANQSASCSDLVETLCYFESTGCGSFGSACCSDADGVYCDATGASGKPLTCWAGKCVGCQ